MQRSMKNNIQKLIYWQLKASKSNRGFITLEVIVALIVGLAFFAISLQAFGTSMVIKAQSIEKQRANELIQEDIERTNQLGSVLATATPSPVCNPAGVNLAATYDNGLAHGLWTALIAAAPSTSPALSKNVVNKVDTTDGSVKTTGGRTLRLERIYASNSGNGSDAPHRTLKIGYRVWYWGDPGTGTNVYLNRAGTQPTATDEPIAETYVEIIPDVALSCP